MSPTLQRCILPLFVFGFAAGCSGQGGPGAGAVSAPAPVPQPSSNSPNARAPRYFNPATTTSPDIIICVPGVTTTFSTCGDPLTHPKSWVEVLAYSFGDSESIFINSGSIVTHPSQFSALSIEKFVDTTSPLMQQLVFNGQSVAGDSRLVETRTDSNGTFPFKEFDLKTATVVDDQISASDPNAPTESVALNFPAMQFAYQPLVGGITGKVIARNWDTVTRAADYAPTPVLPPAGIAGIVTGSARTAFTRNVSRPIRVPAEIVRAVAAKAHESESQIESVLQGNLTELLTIPGITGTSTIPGYTNATEIQDFSIGAAHGTQPEPLNYSLSVDLNAPVEWGIVARSMPYSGTNAELDLVDTTVNPSEKMAYFKLGTPYPESYQEDGTLGVTAQEAQSMFYAQISFCTIPYTNGKAGTPVCSSWNYLTGT